MKSTAALDKPVAGQDNSGLVDAIKRSKNEIQSRGRLLLRGSRVTDIEPDKIEIGELMLYSAIAGDIGYSEMERRGSEIVNLGGTFPAMRITALFEYGDAYALRAVEDHTGIEFTFPCGRFLRQYIGKPLDLSQPNALRGYMREQATIDVTRIGSSYQAIMIGLAKDVLEDGVQASIINLLN